MVEMMDLSVFAEYCQSHDRIEPHRPNDFAVCEGCGHVFRTERKLRRAFDRNWIPWWQWITRRYEPTEFEIDVCAYCGHDLKEKK